MSVRVFIVDDHELFRSGVRAELSAGLEIVGDAGTVDEAISAILATEPDVVVLDVHMPGGGGRRVIEAVHAERPGIRFLALSVSDAAEDVIDVIRAGARGYVTKSISPAELDLAVRRVNDSDAVFSPRLAGFVLDAFGRAAPEPLDPELDLLSAREREVLATSPVVTPTRKSPTSSASRSRPSRPTFRPCSASFSSRVATSSHAGPRTDDSSSLSPGPE